MDPLDPSEDFKEKGAVGAVKDAVADAVGLQIGFRILGLGFRVLGLGLTGSSKGLIVALLL